MEEVTSIIKKGKQTKNHETMPTNFESYWNFLKWMSKSPEGNPLLVTQTDLVCADRLSSRLQFSNIPEIWIPLIVHWVALKEHAQGIS